MPGTPSAVYAFPTMAGADAINQIDEYSVALGSRLDTVISAVPQQAWQTIALTGFTTSLSYYKDSLGTVHFRGEMISTGGTPIASNAVLCTLPAGYRPGVLITLPVASFSSGNYFVSIDPSTGVVRNPASSLAMPASAVFTFGAIHFRAEN